MARNVIVGDEITKYVSETVGRESPLLRRLRAETAPLPDAGMQIGADQGALLGLLVRLLGARRAIEIGTFTGYSSLCIAGALPSDGRLVACDVSEEWTSVARRFWAEAGLDDRIDLRLGPALGTLDALLADDGRDTFDFAFIDADKPNYDAYYERCLRLVRAGGLIAIDNTLWSGRVLDDAVQDAGTQAIRLLNRKVAADVRVDACLLTVGDGVMLARKR